MLLSSIFFISFLPIYKNALVITGATQLRNFDDTRSYLCGKKLFLSRIIKRTLKLVTGPGLNYRNLLSYEGNLNFDYQGPIFLWPLPLRPRGEPWRKGPIPPFYMVLGGDERQFLGIIYKPGGDQYAHCTEANAGGKIKSIIYPDGVFQCSGRISNQDAVRYAGEMRISLENTVIIRGRKYPILYEGDLEFPGQSPHLISPISLDKKAFARRGSQFLVIDANFNVVDALETVNGKYERCMQIYPENRHVSIHIASVTSEHCETGIIKFHDKQISVQQILQAAENAHIGFRRLRIDARYTYPTPYCTIDLNLKCCDGLYLWPVLEEDQKIRNPMATTTEHFFLVIDQWGNVYDLVANVGGTYQSCPKAGLATDPKEIILIC